MFLDGMMGLSTEVESSPSVHLGWKIQAQQNLSSIYAVSFVLQRGVHRAAAGDAEPPRLCQHR